MIQIERHRSNSDIAYAATGDREVFSGFCADTMRRIGVPKEISPDRVLCTSACGEGSCCLRRIRKGEEKCQECTVYCKGFAAIRKAVEEG